MGPTYATVHLQGGPLGGTLAQAPLRGDGTSVPVNIIGLPVPVLDERAETFSWDTANYFLMPPVDGPWRPGGQVALCLRQDAPRVPHLHLGRPTLAGRASIPLARAGVPGRRQTTVRPWRGPAAGRSPRGPATGRGVAGTPAAGRVPEQADRHGHQRDHPPPLSRR